jgi:hypothetical protein
MDFFVCRGKWRAALAAPFLLAACDAEIALIKPYEGEYDELKGRTILVYFANDSDEL